MKKRIVVLGAGESGVGSAVLAIRQGFEVFVSDRGKIKENYKEVLSNNGIRFEEGEHTWEEIEQAETVIKSPGIPDTVEIVEKLRSQEIPVISEIEFAGRYTDAKMICITGSNGKTTTTMLTYHILKNAGLNVGMAGNVGKSFAMSVAEDDHDFYVLELSSFQLDGMFAFKADVAVLMNITPDHLDRYEDRMENYVASKFRIIRNQTADDAFIYWADDPVIMKEVQNRNLKQRLLPFSQKPFNGEGAYLSNSNLIININDKLNMSIHDLALQGKHNAYNSMAAGIAARVLEIRKEIIRDSLADFQNVEHRLEFVARIHGIDFVNDSKATNVNSTWYALESIDKKIVWIVGGVDKGNDYSSLSELVQEKVTAIICLGKDNAKLHEEFDGVVDTIVDVDSADDAVAAGYRYAKKGDAVLLSPACASFDLFENYEDRGNKFKAAVKRL